MLNKVKDKALGLSVKLESAAVGAALGLSSIGVAYAGESDAPSGASGEVFGQISQASGTLKDSIMNVARPVAILSMVVCFGLSMVSFFDAKLTKFFRGAGFASLGAYLLMKLVPAIINYADTLFA